MATMVGIVSRHGLTINEACHIESNLIRGIYCCIIHFFHFNSLLRQLYISKKTDQFSYKLDVMYMGIHILRELKEELAWTIDK